MRKRHRAQSREGKMKTCECIAVAFCSGGVLHSHYDPCKHYSTTVTIIQGANEVGANIELDATDGFWIVLDDDSGAPNAL